MRYRKLTIENFGLYYGRHVLTFGRDRGVWIVYGDNGRGKTTLLNAFRYVLYGKVLTRRAERRPEDVANTRHAAESGQLEFKVILDLEHDGSEYRVTRHFRSHHSPEHVLLVERDGTPLSDAEATKSMLVIAPESISQFFLFDGELLRQYEDLRDPTIDSGRRMRTEVDRLLGVHAVENGIRDLKEVSATINKEKARLLAANAKAENLGVALQEANDKRAALVAALAELVSKRREFIERLADVEDDLSRHERARTVLAQIDVLKGNLTQAEVQRQTALDELASLTADAWRAALLPAVDERLAELRPRMSEVDTRRLEAIVAQRAAHRLELGSECPVCESQLDDAHRADVLRRVHATGSPEEVERLERVVSGLRDQADTLEAVKAGASADLLGEREKAVRKLELAISDIKEDVAELDESLRGIDETEVRRKQRERDDLKLLISNQDRDIAGTEEDIRAQERVSDNIKDQVLRLDVKTDSVLELRDRVTNQLLALFGISLTHYQDEILARVEDQASKLFTEVRAEKEFARLRIREGYGLTIVDDNDVEVVEHSAGYEHLIALSLIAALQRSSPIQGPIVMDSPFGRLDDVHTHNVVAALPQIADQVVLLAFEGEFDRPAAISALGDALAGEYTLERVAVSESRILDGGPT